eukprot:8040500-Lingulodinium_polyedra.AAC.1
MQSCARARVYSRHHKHASAAQPFGRAGGAVERQFAARALAWPRHAGGFDEPRSGAASWLRALKWSATV